MSSVTASPPLSFFDLRRATASPSGVSMGASASEPGAAPLPGRVGTIASLGRSIGGGTVDDVVVVSSSFASFFLSGLAVVVVGAGATGAGRVVGAVALVAGGVGPGRVVVVVVSGGAVVGGGGGGGGGGVVVALGSFTRTVPAMPNGLPSSPMPPWMLQK